MKKRKITFTSEPVTVYLQPLPQLQFNAYPYSGGMSTMDSGDDIIKDIVHKYKDRFKEAWQELSDR
ncbi:MAG: hypothetical protein ACLQED_15460 [Desulfobaccales bacterium]